ncbi:non-ribosomal peptide synthetase [Kitasatospora sp. NPDC093806]|uniref:non-ribosomal peptide synthetase n=1 Tax=Kitasatospora sp. NPDC093806 TaxID=3155075 RepID=UPI00342CE575
MTEVLPPPAHESLIVTERFEEQAARTPDAIAVVFRDRSLTYDQLNRWANRLAWRLREQGVGPESVVGIGVRRGLTMAIAMLAVFKAGGAFVPVDLENPAERQRFVLADSGAVLAISEPGIPADHWGVPVLRPSEEELAAYPADNPPTLTSGDSLLYIVHTSGSTGTPKGIAMHHAPTVRLMDWCKRVYLDRPRALQYFPITSDVCTYEFLAAWWAGGSLVIASEHDRFDIPSVARLIDRHELTTILLPFVALDQLSRYSAKFPESLGSLREIVTTGDRLIVTPEIKAMCDRVGAYLDNQWGSTEINVVTALRLDQPAADWPAVPVIGRPVAGSRVHVLDEHLQPVPINVPGIVHVGGGPLSRGYAGRPDLTAQSFVPDPFADEPGARMYRTGDLGRWRPDGTLEFIGRDDFLIKIHGYRVEPGEIESRLRERSDIGEAVVVATGLGTPEAKLIAYAVPIGERRPSSFELREGLRDTLPAHMIPQVFVLLDEMPMTATGKVDRKSLPPVEEAPAEDRAFVAPRDEVEERVAAIWAEVLDVEKVSVDDDFFALGGHSLLITQVVFRVRAAFEVDLPMRTLFTTPTVAGLSAEIRHARTGSALRWEGAS